MRSMTGYGRGLSEEVSGTQWMVELQGVNRKVLDLNIFLPRDWLRFEMDLRNQISASIDRGQLTVRAQLKVSAIQETASAERIEQLQNLKSSWVGIAQALGYDAKAIDLNFLLNREQSSNFESLPLEEKQLQALLSQALERALTGFIEMKTAEGKELGADMFVRLQTIETSLDFIQNEASQSGNKFYNKLKQRILECTGAEQMDERLMREVALYAEKADISEELTRLRSHLKQAVESLNSPKRSVGRSLEFLVQEMQREMNTVGAKAASLEIVNQTLIMKAELEKIREQVQNIE